MLIVPPTILLASTHFVIVRVNSVMRGVCIFNKQFEFVSIRIGVEFIANFKNPNRPSRKIAVIQSFVSDVIELIQFARIIAKIVGQTNLLFNDIPIFVCILAVFFRF